MNMIIYKAMQKIMFDDRFGLTQAILNGSKTMTRRIIPCCVCQDILTPLRYKGIDVSHNDMVMKHLRYKVGEVVAIAQRYKDAFSPIDWVKKELYQDEKGWNNKMFVKADLMPHRIRITDVKVERLQDISDEDVYKEGFSKESVNNGWGNAAWHWEAMLIYIDGLGRYKEIRSQNPKEAFSFLIDKVSGNGTWEKNPWVFAYSFELVK